MGLPVGVAAIDIGCSSREAIAPTVCSASSVVMEGAISSSGCSTSKSFSAGAFWLIASTSVCGSMPRP